MLCSQETTLEPELEDLLEVVDAKVLESTEALHVGFEVFGNACLEQVVEFFIKGRKFISDDQFAALRKDCLPFE